MFGAGLWFVGADWWTLFCAGIILVLAFWYAERYERKQRRIRESRRDVDLLGALRRIHGRKP